MHLSLSPAVSIILALILAFTASAVISLAPEGLPMPEQPAADRIPALRAVVEQALTEDGYRFSYDEENNSFYLDVQLEGALSSAYMYIDLYQDMVAFYCYPTISVRAEYRDSMAELQTRINWDHSFAQLQMDYQDGRLLAYSRIIVEGVLPGVPEVGAQLFFTQNLLSSYGDALAKVALLGMSPSEALPVTTLSPARSL